MISSRAESLLAWYDQNARVLPWRSDPTPYHVWVSEIMLQQTQVETVIPYYLRFLERFPNLKTLASTDQAEVLTLWEGLGYYSRARNLHKAAAILVRDYQAEIPSDIDKLKKLPGIGRYTAGAIASVAFGLKEAALDGNIRRVYARLLAAREPIGSKELDARLWQFAGEILPDERAGDYNQALMDLGALLCRPEQPDCQSCPMRGFCETFKQGLQQEIPVRKKRKSIPHHTVTAAVIQKDESYLICQRPQNALLGGLWEFPGGKLEPGDADLQACLRREIMEELGVRIEVGQLIGVFKHAYTHFKITLHAFECVLQPGENIALNATRLWVRPDVFENFAMGKVDRQIARQLQSF